MYYSPNHHVVVYDTDKPLSLIQATDGAVRMNGSKLAIPATLDNLQAIRLKGERVPPPLETFGYDYPIRAPWRPLPHQKVTANFLALHHRCLCLNDMGCVGGETLIDTAVGKIPIEALAKRGAPFLVRTLTANGPRFREVNAPFAKGRDDLFRVTFASGRSIVVTKRHVFLTCRGWVSCEQLAVSEQLPVFDVYPQVSIWGPSQLRFLTSAPHLMQTISSLRGRSEIHVYDAPLLRATDSVLDVAPSQAYVQVHNHFEWRTDDLGNKHIRMAPLFDARQSTHHCGVQIDQGEMGAFLSLFATKQTDNQFHISVQYRLFPNQLQEAREGQELRLCIPLSSATAPPFDTVAHIAYERTDVYYDMEVPEHENYVAHGLCNHNTMKTLSALWAADFIMEMERRNGRLCRALVVSPLSILRSVWADALFTHFIGRRSFSVLHGDPAKRLKLLSEPKDFYIINHDGVGIGVPKDRRAFFAGVAGAIQNRDDIRLFIVDEASVYRDAQTKRHRVARTLFASKEDRYLWLMTGTPTPNGPLDAYGLAKLVNNAHGESFTAYKNRIMIPMGPWKLVPRVGAAAEAKKLLSPAIRYAIEDCVDLPPCTVQKRECELSADQAHYYKLLQREAAMLMKSGALVSAANQAALRLKLIQISCGAIYDGDHKAHEIDCEPRVKTLIETIEQCAEKVIVFAPLTSVLHMLQAKLEKHFAEKGYVAKVYGETPIKERTEIFRAFQGEASPRVIVADPGTMAHGLTLTAASAVVWYAPTDKTELYLQANKRIDRPGQTKMTTIVQIASMSIEREIFRRLEANESLQGVILKLAEREK